MPINNLMVDTSGRVTGTIVDNAGTGFRPETLRYTLYDAETKTIINARDDEELTPVGSFVSAVGVLSHTLARADNVLISTTKTSEIHVLRYKWTYNTAADAGVAELRFAVTKDETPTS